jgi:hypothetical protein
VTGGGARCLINAQPRTAATRSIGGERPAKRSALMMMMTTQGIVTSVDAPVNASEIFRNA